MTKKSILIAFFSGTGCTAEVVQLFEQGFYMKAYSVSTLSLESHIYNNPNFQIDQYLHHADLLLILFPVYAFDAPKPIYDFVKLLPQSRQLPSGVIAVSGGGEMWPNTVCRKPTIRALEKKNYRVFYENMVVMPANVLNISNDHMNKRVLDILPLKVEQMVNEVSNGLVLRRGRVFAQSLILKLSDLEKKQAKTFAKKYLAISQLCSRCGWCKKNCPAQNITLVDGLPQFHAQCLFCMRCVYGCPIKAIYSPKYNFIIGREGFNLEHMRVKMKDVPLLPVSKCCKGIAWLGVRKYLKP